MDDEVGKSRSTGPDYKTKRTSLIVFPRCPSFVRAAVSSAISWLSLPKIHGGRTGDFARINILQGEPASSRFLVIVRLVAEHLFVHRDAENLFHYIAVNIRQTKV